MTGLLTALEGAAGQGLLWGFLALSVYISYRILDYADLTVEGSFGLGGAICAICLGSSLHPLLATILGAIAGTAAGFVTGVLHTKLRIAPILSGILSMIALYSINIRVMDFRSNIPLLGKATLFAQADEIVKNGVVLGLGLLLGVITIGGLWLFFQTEIGLGIRATGCGEKMARAQGISTDAMKILALMVSNGLAAFSGALVAQQQSYADVTMGTGAIVTGLASVIIGEALFAKKSGFLWRLTSVFCGSVIYRLVIALVLRGGLKATDLKLITAIVIALVLGSPALRESIKSLGARLMNWEGKTNAQTE